MKQVILKENLYRFATEIGWLGAYLLMEVRLMMMQRKRVFESLVRASVHINSG